MLIYILLDRMRLCTKVIMFIITDIYVLYPVRTYITIVTIMQDTYIFIFLLSKVNLM